MNMNKRIYLFLSIFMCLILSACGNNPNIEQGASAETTETDTSSLDEENNTTSEVGIDLYGTYNQNDLLIKTLEKEYQGIILEIPQIEGLKDTSIQEKINQDICKRVEQAYTNIPQLEYVGYSTMANFANVISISVYAGGMDTYVSVYLNYNLVNGNELSFEELFLADTDTLEIIRNAFRDMLVKDLMQGNYDENKLYKIVKGYTESKDKVFAFSPAHIMFYYKDYVASVKIMDIADEVSIYSKYLTQNSLFERNDIGRKDIFTCVEIPEDSFDIWEYGFLEDNLWYDVTAYKEYFGDDIEEAYLEKYLSFKDDMYSEVLREIETYREIAKKNPERFYIILARPNIYMETEWEWMGDTWVMHYLENASVSKNIQIFEMSQETYEQIYRDKILEAYRYEYLVLQGGIYLEATEEDVIWTEESEVLYYNYITGEQLISE